MLQALVTRCLELPNVAAIVGDRVSMVERVEGASLPALVVNKITPGRDYVHSGPDGLFDPLIQFDCYALSYGAARALAEALVEGLEPRATVGGVQFGRGFLRADRDMSPPDDLGGGDRVYRISLDFNIFYKE